MHAEFGGEPGNPFLSLLFLGFYPHIVGLPETLFPGPLTGKIGFSQSYLPHCYIDLGNWVYRGEK